MIAKQEVNAEMKEKERVFETTKGKFIGEEMEKEMILEDITFEEGLSNKTELPKISFDDSDNDNKTWNCDQ